MGNHAVDADGPGCTVDGCTNAAAFKILHDDRLADQYRCIPHVIGHLNRIVGGGAES